MAASSLVEGRCDEQGRGRREHDGWRNDHHRARRNDDASAHPGGTQAKTGSKPESAKNS